MPAYLIANVEVNDVELFKKYLAATPGILKKYTGRFLVRGGEILDYEGDWGPKRLVIIEFDSFIKAKEFYNSEEYKPLLELRKSITETDLVIVNGISDELMKKLNY